MQKQAHRKVRTAFVIRCKRAVSRHHQHHKHFFAVFRTTWNEKPSYLQTMSNFRLSPWMGPPEIPIHIPQGPFDHWPHESFLIKRCLYHQPLLLLYHPIPPRIFAFSPHIRALFSVLSTTGHRDPRAGSSTKRSIPQPAVRSQQPDHIAENPTLLPTGSWRLCRCVTCGSRI